jgi:hypothetical protein
MLMLNVFIVGWMDGWMVIARGTLNMSDKQTVLPEWRRRKRAGLITPRSPDRSGSPVYIITSQWCIEALEQQTFNRHGAAGARGAHNSEGTGSKPVAGIFNSQFYRSCHAVNTATHRRRSSAEERLNTVSYYLDWKQSELGMVIRS